MAVEWLKEIALVETCITFMATLSLQPRTVTSQHGNSDAAKPPTELSAQNSAQLS